jgi:hypothetical protein
MFARDDKKQAGTLKAAEAEKLFSRDYFLYEKNRIDGRTNLAIIYIILFSHS